MSSYAISSAMPRMYAQPQLARALQSQREASQHSTAAVSARDNSWLQAAAVALPREVVAPGRPSTQRRPNAARSTATPAGAGSAHGSATEASLHVETSLDHHALFANPAPLAAVKNASLPPAEVQLRQQRIAPVRLAAQSLTPQTTAALYARALGR